jgi:transcriptional regulator, LacI family
MLDVAKRAGVSKATVSRVLAGHAYVSKTVRDRVMLAIDEMDYRPNLLARSLATNRSHSIGLMVTQHALQWSLFYRAVIPGRDHDGKTRFTTGAGRW